MALMLASGKTDPTRSSGALLWAFALPIVLGCARAYGADPTLCMPWVAKIVSVQGQVDTRRAGEIQWRPVRLEETLCGGDLVRVSGRSRAAILLRENETTLHLDQRTTITMPRAAPAAPRWLELLRGAANFLSRTPISLKIMTPFLNAHIEGTEFLVRVEKDRTFILVFSGAVLAENSAGSVRLQGGENAVATASQAPTRSLVIHPRDAVVWALYYPPIIDYRSPALTMGVPEIREALRWYRQNDVRAALAKLDQVPDHRRDARYFDLRAALLLSIGRVDEAQSDIAQALRLEGTDATAMALRSVIALVKNEKQKSLRLARKAVSREPQSPVPHIALSYAQQASFDIEAALESSEQATQLAPDNGLAWARIAELELSLGRRGRALEAAEKAVALDPILARTQTVLGFVCLAQINTGEARRAFEQAIRLDSSDPLARLGLGLAKIRQGNLNAGVGEIEIAATLDPNNALVRSYLGKGYYEQKRDTLTSTEYETAKSLDPMDPTPWFYDAIHKHATNRPIEAFHDLQNAIQRNNNRAVYRSRLLLDEDLAARGAALGRIFNDLGFEQRGLVEAWTALSNNPNDYSAHRLLADTYSALPRHEIARVSELLQSQLLQPVNITPVQPQLAESDLFLLGGLGAAEPSLNEFNSLFQRNRFSLLTSGLIGSQDTYSDEVVHSGLWNRLSYSLGQFHYQTAGFRANNDFQTDIYSLFAQALVTPAINVQVELRRQDTQSGDLRETLDPSLISSMLRQDFRRDTVRGGFNLHLSPDSRLIGSFTHRNFSRETRQPEVLEDATFVYEDALFDPALGLTETEQDTVLQALPRLPTTLTTLQEQDIQIDSGAYEIQGSGRWPRWSLIAGVGVTAEERENEFRDTQSRAPIAEGAERTTLPQAFLDFIEKPTIARNDSETTHVGGYVYSHIDFPADVVGTIGVEVHAADRNGPGDQLDWNRTYINPKLGVMWRPFSDTVIRAAWFKYVKRPLVSGQTIEPTHVAGFNQFYDDFDNTRAERYGVAVDQVLGSGLMGGLELSWRRATSPLFVTGGRINTLDQDEAAHRLYINWALTDRLAATAEYFFERFDRTPGSAPGLPDEFTSHRIPMTLGYFDPRGVFSKVAITYLNQDAQLFEGPPAAEEFWTVDVSVGYRMPKRWGIVTVGVKNLFDERFLFQGSNFNIGGEPVPLVFAPERVVFGQVTLAF